MNGVTGGVVGVLPWGTTTFSHTSTTVRRRSAGNSVSSWRRVFPEMSLDEGEEGSTSCSAGLGEEEDSTMVSQVGRAVSDILRIGLEVWLVEDLLLALDTFEGEVLRADEIKTESEGEDLAILRERGVGILDIVREDVGLENGGLVSREGPIGVVIVLTEGKDNW